MIALLYSAFLILTFAVSTKSLGCITKTLSSKNVNFHLIKQSTDFFSLSNLRDLLFHVQEHTFTISQIIKHLNHLKLTFSGFENRDIINLFKNKHNNKKDLYNLNLWKKFEIDNPRIFAGMYQFWCQKKL